MSQIYPQYQKRNINLSDKRTSLVLDAHHWARLDHILIDESLSLDMLVQDIELRRGPLSLASACRIFILMYMNCKMEHVTAQRTLQTTTLDDTFMVAEDEGNNPPVFFQALSLLGRYAAQSA